MNKTLLTICKIILHIVAFPLLFALLFILNRNVIAGGSMYGMAVFVCFIVAAVAAVIFYLTYFLVRTKKKRSIRNQHIIIAIVAVLSLSGFWMLLDAFIPAPLEDATSSTLRWEDLSDNWGARAEVHEQLLHDYVTINYTLGRLTSPNGETAEDYISQGPNGNAELAALLAADFHSIDSDGYASYKGPAIDYAQSDRMTIPVLLHLFLDDRSAVQGANSEYAKANNLDELTIAVPYYDLYLVGDDETATEEDVRIYHGYVDGEARFLITDQDLNVLDAYTTENLAVVSRYEGSWVLTTKVIDPVDNTATVEYERYDTKEDAIDDIDDTVFTFYFEGGYKQASVGWHVLDMLGTAMEMNILSEPLLKTNIANMLSGIDLGTFQGVVNGVLNVMHNKEVSVVADVFQLDLVPDSLVLVADMLNEKEVLGSPLYISVDAQTGTLSLVPSNSHRGVLGYMEMAWLNNQGLLYIIVSLFSTRTLFYAYAPFMAIIALLLGYIREKELALKAAGGAEPKKEKKAKAKKEGKEKATVQDKPIVAADDLLDEDILEEEDEPITAGSDLSDFDV